MNGFGLPLIFAGIIFLIIGMVKWKKASSFANEPLCEAKVTNVKTGSIRVNRGRTKTYSLVVSYTMDGVNYSKELPSTRYEVEGAIGKTIKIRYKKSNLEKILRGRHSKIREKCKNCFGYQSCTTRNRDNNVFRVKFIDILFLEATRAFCERVKGGLL